MNTQQCFVAKLVDSSSQPLANMAIAFDVAGVNTQQTTATTSATGEAQLCYAGANAGSDTLSATSGPLKQTATAAWTVTPMTQTLSLTPASLTGNVNTTQCFTATLLDANNNPVANQVVNFSVDGVNVQSSSLNTDSSGNAKLCYSSAKAGVDTISATADSEPKSARIKALQIKTASMTWLGGGGTTPPSAQPTPVPALHPAMLGLLAACMGGLVWYQRRRMGHA